MFQNILEELTLWNGWWKKYTDNIALFKYKFKIQYVMFVRKLYVQKAHNLKLINLSTVILND